MMINIASAKITGSNFAYSFPLNIALLKISNTVTQVRLAEWSKAPDLSSGSREGAWVRTPHLTKLYFDIHYKKEHNVKILPTARLELAIFGLGDRRRIHWATRAVWKWLQKLNIYLGTCYL